MPVKEGTSTARPGPVLGVDRSEDATVVRLTGELDLYNAPELRETLVGLAGERPARLVLDLTEVEFVDSTALGVLIEARSRMDDRKAFLLAAPGFETRRALKISGLDQHLTVHATLADALAAQL